MPRKLDNWLETFMDWTVPRSEAPTSLITWSGLFAMSSTIKDHVKFPKSIMGSYEIIPNLYVLFVGPPGVIRKSTTAGYAEELLNEVWDMESQAGVTLASTAMSASKLIETLSATPDGTISILSSEFSNFIGVSQEVMYDVLTDLFDGKVKYEYATRAYGIEKIDRPVVNLLGATTPAWISSQAPEHIVEGGFSSRVIFIFEKEVRERHLYYNIDWPMYEAKKELLVHDLQHMALLKGEFKHESKSVRDEMEVWYQKSTNKAEQDGRIQGYYNRRHVHVHKIAMLLSLAERDDLVLTRGHFRKAVALLESSEKNMPKALQHVGRNPYGKDIEDVHDYIEARHRWVPSNEVFSRFYHDLDPQALKTVLESLVKIGYVDVKNISGSPHYKARSQGSQEKSSPPADTS